MTTCWVIELHPLNGRGKSWFHTGTLRHTRKEAWLAVLGEYQTDMWRNAAANLVRSGYKLYTHPPAPKAITASNVDADIEYWRQKYLKLDAMYDELEKEKIAIEQNLMDRT